MADTDGLARQLEQLVKDGLAADLTATAAAVAPRLGAERLQAALARDASPTALVALALHTVAARLLHTAVTTGSLRQMFSVLLVWLKYLRPLRPQQPPTVLSDRAAGVACRQPHVLALALAALADAAPAPAAAAALRAARPPALRPKAEIEPAPPRAPHPHWLVWSRTLSGHLLQNLSALPAG